MISKDPHDSGPAAITIRSWTCLINRMFLPLLVCAGVASLFWLVSVIAVCIVAALEGILLLYQARRHGVRFDDSGITVRNFYRTHKLSWHDVSRFTDGQFLIGGDAGPGAYSWVVEIVLNNGHSVTAEGTMRDKESNVAKMLATMEQVAARWQIPAQLTGKMPG